MRGEPHAEQLSAFDPDSGRAGVVSKVGPRHDHRGQTYGCGAGHIRPTLDHESPTDLVGSRSSTLIVFAARNRARTMARPRPISAAATAIVNNVSTCPLWTLSASQESNATRLRFAALSMSSTPRSMRTALRRARTP